MDNAPPRCAGGECLLPALVPEAARALRLRSLIIRLRGLVDADAVLRAANASERDIMLLAASEDAIREMDDDKDRA